MLDQQEKNEPFSQGHSFKVIYLEQDDYIYGIIVKVREELRIGNAPMLGTEIIDENNDKLAYINGYFEWHYE
ncbi:hypothetical protein DSLASN_28320 [Desulfoluna limicola]|uniref:DUF35 domain-containing protein n=1 Tax=Desulfoluna limicola TaxID=2810562 RepID=A0ABM7PHZ2_9BACT|nr:hypothetical protein DSLASN_28320 [Desulfoluna limicola]